jgi:hypothetical protein
MNSRNLRIVLLLLSFFVCSSFVSSLAVSVQGQADIEDFKGPGYCLDCHPDQMESWLGTPHSQAYDNPEFKFEWEKLGSPEECLQCHTTGYEKKSGTFLFEGVTCEACHGPGDAMERNVTVEQCAECHSSPFPTYEEWKESGPSHIEARCILCHDEHTSELKGVTPTDTCTTCHEFHLEEITQTKHYENNVECSECHMYVSPVDFEKGVPASTGHSFLMNEDQLDCNTCHDRTLNKHDELGEKAFACLSCHGEIHSLELRLINGTHIPLDDSVDLCAQCHNERYTAWKQGTHGSEQDPQAQCVECHDPHDPIVAGISILEPVKPRTSASGPSISVTTGVIIIVELLGFMIIIWRWNPNV